MKVIITGRHGLKIDDNLRSYINEKILKYESLINEPAVCDVMLADVRGPQNGVDKVVHLTLELPNEKNPLHVEVVTSDFFGSVDLAQEKLEREILKYKEKTKIGTRFPKKYR